MDERSALYQTFGRKKLSSRAFIGIAIRNQRSDLCNFTTSHVDICKNKKEREKMIKFGCTCKVVFKSESNEERKCQSVHVRQVNGSENCDILIMNCL